MDHKDLQVDHRAYVPFRKQIISNLSRTVRSQTVRCPSVTASATAGDFSN